MGGLLSSVAMEKSIVWLTDGIFSPLLFSPDVWSRMGLSLFLPEPSLPTRNCVGCKYSSTLTSGINNTDENKRLKAGKRSDNWQSSHSTAKEHEVFILSEPKEHILVLRHGVAWKATTLMLHEHNNSSHLSFAAYWYSPG